MTSAQQIRDGLGGEGAISMPGVYDGLSARLAGLAGFPVLFVSGFAVAGSRRGLPDYGFIGASEMIDATRAVCAATDRPVIADADTGYGNALNARDTARRLHDAGAAGIFLEDQEWPKKCGHFSGKRVVPAAEWLAKLQAVIDLRGEGVDLFLVARTDARAAESLEAAIARAIAAAALGVDAIFIEAPRSAVELARIRDEVPAAIRVANMVAGGRTPLMSVEQLAELGHRLVVTPLSGLLASAAALRAAYAALRAGEPADSGSPPALGFDEFGEVVGLPAQREIEARYTTPDGPVAP